MVATPPPPSTSSRLLPSPSCWGVDKPPKVHLTHTNRLPPLPYWHVAFGAFYVIKAAAEELHHHLLAPPSRDGGGKQWWVWQPFKLRLTNASDETVMAGCCVVWRLSLVCAIRFADVCRFWPPLLRVTHLMLKLKSNVMETSANARGLCSCFIALNFQFPRNDLPLDSTSQHANASLKQSLRSLEKKKKKILCARFHFPPPAVIWSVEQSRNGLLH